MSLSQTLKTYLDSQGIPYQVIHHDPTPSANRSAEAAHIPGDKLVKAVVLEDNGQYILAALPATRRLKLGRLHHTLGEHVGLATEAEVERLFGDCAQGAVPALGSAYGLETLVDDSLNDQDEVYIEGGDHESLVCLSGSAFMGLLGPARHGNFSAHI
ncbi:YbaK/prolyl-tRNA synthetase associated region [Thioalkalivibrio sulfidiphilus HL-EbGr7]|uniref:YbaK/prolyl-tRNA synthetase associated region n=1 Tax=Thioalkalivibrio sulfidiphilus (strain HL-EbGR7) TaxID=396588 RepID=B8GPP0_THISH|nr:YbaK/EbsC family protein [Thioalkalivibrio sulfidiphilus]ACL72207.1 YbaK/prolyl-tRNA synthetase associated region [Thioalkalivibrio sulfidiphilus HL-EbGr7]